MSPCDNCIDEQLVFWLCYPIRSMISAIFMIILFLRYRQIKICSVSYMKLNYRIWCRFVLLILTAVGFAIRIAFDTSSIDLWVFQPPLKVYSWLLLVAMVALVFQAYIIKLEYKKKIPSMWLHRLYWIINLIIELVILITSLIYDSKNN